MGAFIPTNPAGGGGGGGGTPGGTPTQFQFNNSAAFDGTPNFSWGAATHTITYDQILGQPGMVMTSIATGNELLSLTNNAITTNRILGISSNSNSANAHELIRIQNLNSASAATKAITILNAGQSTVPTFEVICNAIVSGNIMSLTSSSADTTTRSLGIIVNDDALATGTTNLELRNDSTGLVLNAIGGGGIQSQRLIVLQPAFTTGTPADPVSFTFGAHTGLDTAEVTDVDWNPTFRTVTFTGDGGTIADQRQFHIQRSTYASGAAGVTMTDASTVLINGAPNAGANVTITNPMALRVGSGAASFGGNVGIGIKNPASELHLVSTATTAFSMLVQADSLTTGGVARFASNTSNASGRSIVQINQDNTNADGSFALSITQEGISRAISVNTPRTTASNVLDIVSCDSLTTGGVARFQSNSDNTENRSLVQMQNDHTAATGATVLEVIQDALGPPSLKMSGLGAAIVIDELAGAPYTDTAGDGQLWVRNDAPNNAMFTDDSGDDFILNLGLIAPFGGDLAGANYAITNGIYNVAAAGARDHRSRWISPQRGNLKTLSWISTAADNTTQMRIYVNSTIRDTVTLSGAEGSMDLPSSFLVNATDSISVQFSATGTAPGESVWQVLVG